MALQHLILVPTGGLCNRLRAIASARRLVRSLGLRGYVGWNWGHFEDYFEPIPELEFVAKSPFKAEKIVHHQPQRIDPSPHRWADVNVSSLELHSGYIFYGSHEIPDQNYAALRENLPVLNKRLREAVDDFHARHLKNAVGFHIRRTDNTLSCSGSPDRLFIGHARRIKSQGKKVFLATDNTKTEQMMKNLFGDMIVTYPKRAPLPQRWPRTFDLLATEDDVMDLFLLAKTEYVIGSVRSSYTQLAIVMNGARRSEIAVAKSLFKLRMRFTRARWWWNRVIKSVMEQVRR